MSREFKISRVKDDDSEIVEGEYIYRGIIVERNDSLKGYWGHYSARIRVGDSRRISSDTRKSILDEIDSILDKRKEQQ